MKLPFFFSLRARLMFLILLGSVPLIIIVIYAGLELRNHAVDDVKQNAKHMVMMAANEQDRLLKQTHKLLSILVHIPKIQHGDAASCNSLLSKLLEEDKTYANFGVIDLNGDILCSAIPMKGHVNVSDRSYFQRTLESRDFAIGDYQIGRITKTPVMVFSYPIFIDNKQLKAVLFAALPLSWLENLTNETPLPPESNITVIDHSTHTLLAQYPESTASIGSSLEQSQLIEVIHASGGTGTGYLTDLDNVERLHVFRSLQHLPNGKVINISIGIPLKLVYAKANASVAQNLTILLFMVVLLLFITWYGSTVLVIRQVTALLKITRRLTSGDLDARLDISKSKNEISDLGHEFNQMAVALKKRDTEVKQVEYMLHNNEEKLRHVVEAVPDILYTALPTNNFAAIFVSPALTRLLGFTVEEYLEDSDFWSRNIHDEDRERVIKYMESTVNSTIKDFQIEYRMWHKNRKNILWFEDRAHITRDEVGEAMKIYGVMTDISERKQYIAELEHKALYDSLTDLPNRSLFQDRLEHALTVARRDDTPLAVFTVDVSRLREVNDILGHNAGDLVIQEVGTRLHKTLRASDTVARLGGDEYAIVLPKVNMKQATAAATKIQKLFEAPIIVDDISLEIEVAIGIALYPEHSDEADILLQYADIALHMAKNEAVGFSTYSPKENPYSLKRLKLLGELRHALKHKELSLYYQPQIDLKTGHITSVEALARWPHKTEGMIPPDNFIPMVEQSGLIQPFTLWVLEEAIKQLKHWSDAGIDLSIAVNLSTRNLLDVKLPHDIKNLLEHYKVNPAFLILEVTESAVMTRPEKALKALTLLHIMGHKLSIDDFGTGYSSLAYLKKLPVHELKIDQSFISGLTTNDDNAIIVHSTIDLAHNMGLKVVAEGVENQKTMDMLEILRCDIAQGYLMSRPLPIREFESWLIDSPWGYQRKS